MEPYIEFRGTLQKSGFRAQYVVRLHMSGCSVSPAWVRSSEGSCPCLPGASSFSAGRAALDWCSAPLKGR